MRSLRSPQSSVRIAVLAFDGCMPMQLFGMTDVLRIATDINRRMGAKQLLRLDAEVVAVGGKEVRLAGGMCVRPKRPTGRYDLLVVPGMEARMGQDWDDVLSPLAKEVQYIRRTFSKGAQVASICVGAFLLGRAGLLDHRRSTTAWLFAPELARRHPNAGVDAEAMLIDDGGVISAGAVSSTFDLAVHLIKQFLGAQVATATASVALLPSERRSQSPYVDERLRASSLPKFSEQVQRWMVCRLSEPFDLQTIAEAFHISSRTLIRRVKDETGQTPLSMMQALRMEEAKKLLQSTRLSTAQVMASVGYTDASSFSRLFVQHVGETPAQFRRR